jgi:Chs5-Arf1p-binding protein BUD7/BCH1
MRKLVEEEGALKIRSIIQSTTLPQHVMDLTHEYAQVLLAFKSTGTDG